MQGTVVSVDGSDPTEQRLPHATALAKAVKAHRLRVFSLRLKVYVGDA